MTTAREKLNAIAIRTALILGAIAAMVAQSIPMGLLASTLVFAASLASGDYRPKPGKPGSNPRKR